MSRFSVSPSPGKSDKQEGSGVDTYRTGKERKKDKEVEDKDLKHYMAGVMGFLSMILTGKLDFSSIGGQAELRVSKLRPHFFFSLSHLLSDNFCLVTYCYEQATADSQK